MSSPISFVIWWKSELPVAVCVESLDAQGLGSAAAPTPIKLVDVAGYDSEKMILSLLLVSGGEVPELHSSSTSCIQTGLSHTHLAGATSSAAIAMILSL
ncbi:MAG: hypothetical protein GY696_06140 [Gammaproteobacteria bacterium]|nr:hypothetical protein [Gammaproteobacteria bacterium]